MNITLKKEYHSESNGGILSILGKIGKKNILFDIYLFKKMMALKCDFNKWDVTKNCDCS